MKIGIFYFSGSGITEKYAKDIGKELSKRKEDEINLVNILSPSRMEVSTNEYEACIFGFPVYSGRIPKVAEQWLLNLNGKQKPCSMFFTYGAVNLGHANQVTYYLLKDNKFEVVLSAEFLGAHTFNVATGWDLASNRPNEDDLNVASVYAKQARELFSNPQPFVIDLSTFEFQPREDKEIKGPFSIFLPSRRGRDCQMCYRCEKKCPTEAFDAESGEADPHQCILCMFCVKNCPDQVIQVSNAEELFVKFMSKCKLTKEIVKHKRSRIYAKYSPPNQ